jgi:Big-like domain-containing protein
MPNANFNGTDSFTYRAADGAAGSHLATVTITVNPVIDLPGPVTPPTTNPPPIEAGDDPPPVIETPPIEVDVEDLPTPGEPGTQTTSRITTELTPRPVKPPQDDVSQESTTPTLTVSVLQLPARSAELSEDTADSSPIADDTADDAAPTSPPLGSGDSPYAHLQRPGAFWKGLDEVRQAVDDEVQTQTVFVGAALATASGLSVGYVIWLARSGVLLTSLLAQLPSWRLVDPLVVLDYADDRRNKNPRDDESLEDVIATPSFREHTS